MAADPRATIRRFLRFEVLVFALASLVHAGYMLSGYAHFEAHVAETVIAIVLLVSLILTWIRPAWTRAAGIAGQGFALLGTLVGLFTIAIGVGPRTALDVAYHLAIVAVLAWGLVYAIRARGGPGVSTTAPIA